jgi:tetratricopeptide (TPR) repeat protein
LEDNNNISAELLETIERYLNNDLNARELDDFNRLLKLDNEFEALVEDVKTMLLGIEKQTLKETLDGFHKDIPKTTVKAPKDKKVRYLNFSKIAVATSIVIALGSIWFFSTSKNEKLYAKYFKPDPGLPTTMGSTDNFDFYDAMAKYKHGDYNMAIEKWQVLSEKKPENDTLNYFLGVAHLANKDEAKAIPFLEETVDAPDDFVFLNDAYFYLGLAHLKAGNMELAKKNLTLSNTEKGKEIVLKLRP